MLESFDHGATLVVSCSTLKLCFLSYVSTYGRFVDLEGAYDGGLALIRVGAFATTGSAYSLLD